MKGEKSETFLVKVGICPAFTGELQKEASNLLRLERLGILRIPSVVSSGYVDERYYFAERFIPASQIIISRSSFNIILPEVRKWLGELYVKTLFGHISSDALIKKTVNRLESISEFFDFAQAIYVMEATKPAIDVPTATIHGNLNNENILIHGSELFYTDFGFASDSEPPVDILDMIIHFNPNLLLDKHILNTAVSELIPNSIDPIFLSIYSLIRRLHLRIEILKKMYDQLLISNLETMLTEVREAGLLKDLLSKLNRPRHNF
jgi:hypothetical protein